MQVDCESSMLFAALLRAYHRNDNFCTVSKIGNMGTAHITQSSQHKHEKDHS